MRRGVLWDAHRRYYGKDGQVLVWQSDTRAMNPTVAERVIEEALERDASAAQSEWLAQFRSDLESYVDREAVEASIEPGVRERLAGLRVPVYGFVDPSGGRQDSMTMAIAHREADCVVLDCVRERRPPFFPTGVVGEFAARLRLMACGGAVGSLGWRVGDRAFRAQGIRCEAAASRSRTFTASCCRRSTRGGWYCWTCRGWWRSWWAWSGGLAAVGGTASITRRGA